MHSNALFIHFDSIENLALCIGTILYLLKRLFYGCQIIAYEIFHILIDLIFLLRDTPEDVNDFVKFLRSIASDISL